MAPKNHFKKIRKIKEKDPLLFCLTDNGNYELVAKWGNDINILRSINPFTKANWVLTMFMVIFSITCYSIIPNSTNALDKMFGFTFIMIFGVFALLGIEFLFDKFHIGNWDFRYENFE